MPTAPLLAPLTTLIILGGTWGLLAQCGSENSPSPTGLPHTTEAELTLSYELTWNLRDITPEEDGTLRWQTNLGYELRLVEGFLTSFSAQVVPCDPAQSTGLTPLLEALGFPRPAFAGHGSADTNPAALTTPHIERLTPLPRSHAFGEASVSAGTFCQTHYLIAGATENATNLPSSPNMLGTSLYLRGHFREAQSQRWRDFEVHTALANGLLAPLQTIEGRSVDQISSSTGEVTVMIERTLAGFFEDVDFKDVTPTKLERQLLSSVIAHTRTRVRLP